MRSVSAQPSTGPSAHQLVMHPDHKSGLRPAHTADEPPDLIEFVDFKWLMAGEGHRIDVDRLQTDTTYARACLALAQGSTSATLRRSAERLAPCVPAVSTYTGP